MPLKESMLRDSPMPRTENPDGASCGVTAELIAFQCGSGTVGSIAIQDVTGDEMP
jgi:hypothetical protein